MIRRRRGHPQCIHRSRGAIAGVIVALGATAMMTTGCGSKPGAAPVPTDLLLSAIPATVRIGPGERGMLNFSLQTSQGVGVPGQRISFVIADDAENQPKGATLTADSAITDAMGDAVVGVNAGAKTLFHVVATTQDGSADTVAVVVVSSMGRLANVQIAPVLTGDAAAAGNLMIEVSFFDDNQCSKLTLADLSAPVRPVRVIATSDGVAEFDLVDPTLAHAVNGRARDRRNVVQAQGCIDLSGMTLVPDGLVRVALPLPDASPSPVGRFDVTSRVTLGDPATLEAPIAAPWIDLQDCPLDPAQLWLDCTIDALSGAVPGDPIDCHPLEGAEGPLGALLVARRGVLLLDAAGAPSGCRGSRDATGTPSNDGILASLFGAPKPAALVGLHDVASDAAQILSALTLNSHLQIDAAPGAGALVATHTFESASFGAGPAPAVVVNLLPLGLPTLEASFIPASDSGDVLTLEPHGITLRLGMVARAGFGELALVRRGWPADAPGFLQALVRLASTPLPMRIDQATADTGCAALDAVLCADVGQARGCLLAACNDGLTALAALLDAGFAMADGDGLDLDIDGAVAPIIDMHRTGQADRLGDATALPPQPGTWSATLHARAGDQELSATWDASRSVN